jgi:hypothetical protein
MAERTRDGRWQARFALGSLCLHALLLGLGLTRLHRHDAEQQLVPAKPDIEIDVLPDEVASAPTEEHTESEPEPREASRQVRSGKALHDAAPVEATDEPQTATADTAQGEAPGDTADAPAAAPSAAAPHLSLAALGVDGQNPFLERADPAAVRAAKIARAKRRLDNSLAQGLMNQDVASGRGAGSPVVRSLETAVYASTVPLNGSALFTLIIDSDGKLVSNTLGETSGDRESWARVARQTARSLAPRKLMVPKGKSVRLTVAVTSHLELPSGRDPGLEVDAFGIPIRKGGGPRSTKLDILNPVHPLSTIALDADPADAAARPRRMVHAHVVSEELL